VAVQGGLAGKRALVAGGSHGIGLAIARALAGAGCNVAICSRSKSRLDAAEAALRRMNVEALALPADVLDPDSIRDVTDAIDRVWGASTS